VSDISRLPAFWVGILLSLLSGCGPKEECTTTTVKNSDGFVVSRETVCTETTTTSK
jgi:hypothetical protein